MEPKVISALDYTVYSEKSSKYVSGQNVNDKIQKLIRSNGSDIHAAPQSYFVDTDNTKNNLLYTYGMGPCHTLIVYVKNGPAFLGHIDTDSLLCPVFMTQKLLEMIRDYDSNLITVVFIEPDTKGRKEKFSHILSYNYFRFLKREKGYNYSMWRYIIPAIEEEPINLVALENNTIYILGSSSISKKLVRLSTMMKHWEIVSCPAGKQTFEDDLLWSCPVKNRFTRGIKGTDTFGMELSQIVDYVMDNITLKQQNRIFTQYFRDIDMVLQTLLSYNNSKDYPEEDFNKIGQGVSSRINKQLATSISSKQILKIFCTWFTIEHNEKNPDTVRLVAKFLEEIYLHSFVNIINVATGDRI